MNRIHFLGFVFCLLLSHTTAQSSFYDFGFARDTSVSVHENGRQLAFPWAGGANSVHFSEIDLNLDGVLDLLGFEKHGNRLLPFLRQGDTFVYAPQYARRFPDLHDWMILNDYNHDGKPDIFTYGLASIRVYENVSTDALQFQLVADPLQAFYYNGYTNIYASPDDYLVVDDVDGDGHLDILNFWVLGKYMHRLRNYAADGEPFDFHLEEECWGHFSEAADNNTVTLFTDCSDKSDDGPTRHTGSSMLLHDFDGNGLPDLLLGDVDSPYGILLYNHGTLSDARMTVQDTMFPSSMPISLYSMPAASLVLLPGREMPSLVVSPSDPSLSKSQDLHSIWVYDYDTVLQHYVMTETDFLQGDMLDVGSGCHPVLYDFDGDGLLDLFFGNYGQFDSAKRENGWLTAYFSASVSYYKNAGTLSAPHFVLQTHDFGNLRSLNLNALHPTFGDLDGDGQPDMLCGLQDGTLMLVPHERLTTGYGAVMEHYAGVDVGEYSTPQLFDLDGDGKEDLLVGNRRGWIAYYRNEGVNQPVFQKITDTLGGVDVRDYTLSYFGFSVPCFFRDPQHGTVLFCGSEQGDISYYRQIDGNLTGEFEKAEANLVETLGGMAYGFREGRRVAPAVGDLNGDSRPDMLLGNYAGGAALFWGAEPPEHTLVPSHASCEVRVWPNPTHGTVCVETPGEMSSLVLYDLLGRPLRTFPAPRQTKTDMDLSEYSPGVYFLVIDHQRTVKIVLLP